ACLLVSFEVCSDFGSSLDSSFVSFLTGVLSSVFSLDTSVVAGSAVSDCACLLSFVGAASVTLAPFISNSCPTTIRSDDRLFHFLIFLTDRSNSLAMLDKVSPCSTTYTSSVSSFIIIVCFVCITFVFSPFISTSSSIVVLLSFAMVQRLSPCLTSYSSADTLVAAAPTIIMPVANMATNFFISSTSSNF